MLVIGNGNDDKLSRSILEKLFKDALISIKERCKEHFNNSRNILLEGAPYLGTSKIISVGSDKLEKPILVLKPGLWRGESPQWNIHCEVFEKDFMEIIIVEELKAKIINQLKVPVGLNIIERHQTKQKSVL